MLLLVLYDLIKSEPNRFSPVKSLFAELVQLSGLANRLFPVPEFWLFSVVLAYQFSLGLNW